MASTTSLMVSFSQPERFIWQNDALTVIIPNGSITTYHPRASLSELKAILVPQLRLTRAGNISERQPDPPPPKPYDFYLAQLIHYGLDFHFRIEDAQRALEIEIRLERLRVPPSLVRLEKELEKAHRRAQNKAHQDTIRFVPKQQLANNHRGVIAAKSPKNESEDEAAQRSVDSRSGEKKRKQRKIVIERSTESEDTEDESSDRESSGNDTDEDDDTVAVAPDSHDSRSSSTSTSSMSSSEEVQNVKGSGSTPRVNGNIESESSEEISDDDEESKEGEGTNEESGSNDDPFLDRQDLKRINLEKIDKHDRSLRNSTRTVVPSTSRKQPPPSQVKIRRIGSSSQDANSPNKSISGKPLNVHSASTTPAAPTTTTTRKSKFDPAKRPSWSIPFRSSSFSPQIDTPKSVTFSQVQRETPSKVPEKEKEGFSSTLKAAQGSPHTPRKQPSFSFDHVQPTPLRSILKKTIGYENAVQTPFDLDAIEAEPLTQTSHDADTTKASRLRKRKRKSSIRDDFRDLSETSAVEKPFITSDVVDCVLIPSQKNGGSGTRAAASIQDNGGVLSQKSTAGSSTGKWGDFIAVNSDAYQQRQHHAQDQLANTLGALQGRTPGSARSGEKRKLSVKDGGVVTLDPKKNEFGSGTGQRPGMGSRSRGSLVRAGRVY